MFEKDSGLDIETDVSGGESGGGGGGGDTLVSTTGSVHTVFPLLGSTMNARPFASRKDFECEWFIEGPEKDDEEWPKTADLECLCAPGKRAAFALKDLRRSSRLTLKSTFKLDLRTGQLGEAMPGCGSELVNVVD